MARVRTMVPSQILNEGPYIRTLCDFVAISGLAAVDARSPS